MPSDEQMRDKVRKAYPGKHWREKVDAMSDEQVAAVYLRLLNSTNLKR